MRPYIPPGEGERRRREGGRGGEKGGGGREEITYVLLGVSGAEPLPFAFENKVNQGPRVCHGGLGRKKGRKGGREGVREGGREGERKRRGWFKITRDREDEGPSVGVTPRETRERDASILGGSGEVYICIYTQAGRRHPPQHTTYLPYLENNRTALPNDGLPSLPPSILARPPFLLPLLLLLLGGSHQSGSASGRGRCCMSVGIGRERGKVGRKEGQRERLVSPLDGAISL